MIVAADAPYPPLPRPPMRAIAERILHRDKDLVVVDKPDGLISCGPDRLLPTELVPRQSIESLLQRHLGQRVWAVHQLDRNTSGLNLFVLKKSLVIAYNDRLRVAGAKRYLAVVHGTPSAEETFVDHPIGERVHTSGKLYPALVAASDPTAKHARSLVRRLCARAGFALVEVIPETGRTHQVRLHLAALGHPLVGEPVHREPPCTLHPRHALHAARLDFVASARLPEQHFAAPLPADLVALIARLGLTPPTDLVSAPPP